MSLLDPNPITKGDLPDTFVMDQSKEVLSGIEFKEVAPPREELTSIQGSTRYAEDFNEALKYSPSMRKDWTPEPEWTSGNTFGQALWNSMKRDSWLGNIGRLTDQAIAGTQQSEINDGLIWDNQEALVHGISPIYHDDILQAPTFGLAKRESNRIRLREAALKREHNTHIGKTIAADMAGFFLDPTNLIPGYGIVKGIALAKRMSSIAVLRGVAASSKGRQMAGFATVGAFEEAIRMAPRYASDPTFETMEYMENIAMSAAFSGILPAVFGGVQAGLRKLPALNDDMQRNLHSWGVDVGVRQAMRFPGELKETGFADPGTAARKAKEKAQDSVDAKVKEFNKTAEKKKAKEAIDEDMSGETPSNEKLMGWMEEKLDQAGDAAIKRLKHKLKRTVASAAGVAVATGIAGPIGGVVAAAFFTNKDYLAAGLKLALKHKKERRVAYDAAVSAGDHEAAAEILKGARKQKKPTPEETVDEMEVNIRESVEEAKRKLRAANEKAWACA